MKIFPLFMNCTLIDEVQAYLYHVLCVQELEAIILVSPYGTLLNAFGSSPDRCVHVRHGLKSVVTLNYPSCKGYNYTIDQSKGGTSPSQ